MNRAAKGRRAEHRSIALLEQQGYLCVRSAASMGALRAVACPTTVRKLIHRWRPRQSAPDVRGIMRTSNTRRSNWE